MTASTRQSHRDLILWQKAIVLAVDVHRLVLSFPRSELFGLGAQMRRAAVSVPSNIAEGTARRTTKEFVAFLHIARGSLAELETQLILSKSLGYADGPAAAHLQDRIAEVGRILNAVLAGLRRRMKLRSSAIPQPLPPIP